jgi:hypothetical protein
MPVRLQPSSLERTVPVTPNVKGQPRRGGRPKGTPNKATVVARDIIAETAHKLGGTKRLLAWCKESKINERIFWGSIFPKLLPLQVTGANGGPIQVEDSRADEIRRRLLQDAAIDVEAAPAVEADGRGTDGTGV